MFTRLTSSAATKFVIAVASFFSVTGVVGFTELGLYQDQLLMALIPSSLSASTLLIGMGYFALLYRKRVFARLVGCCLLAIIAVVFALVVYADTTSLLALPLEVVMTVVGGTALLFIVSPKSSFGRWLWPIILALNLLVFVLLQSSIWGLSVLPGLDSEQANYLALTLVAMHILFGTASLAMLYWFSRRTYNCRPILKRTLVTIVVIVATGFGVWYSSSYSDLAAASDKARTKIAMIGNMIDETLSEQRKLARRLQERIATTESEAHFQYLLTDHLEVYPQDYPIIRGFVVFDEQAQPYTSTHYGDQFLAQGHLASERFHQWLQSIEATPEVIISGTSLTTDNPTFMIGIPAPSPSGEFYRVVMLMDINRVITPEYIEPFADMRTYLRLNSELLIPMGDDTSQVITEAELSEHFPHYLAASVMLGQGAQTTFYSVLGDYAEIKANAQINQLMLWLTFAFIFIYVLAEDNAQRLVDKQDELRYLALHDEITGLLRRDTFTNYLNQRDAIAASLAPHYRAILFLNLDGFKPINDSLGHRLGDDVLAETAARIRAVSPADARVARFSGDEFVIYFESNTEVDLQKVAETLLRVVRKPYFINNIEVHLTVSIGAVSSNGDDRHASNMMQHAEIAMSQAKQLGGNLAQHFVSQMAQDYQRQVQLRNALQLALDKNELEVHYQPIYDTQSRKIVAIESLVRWRDNGAYVSPAEFIPIAESTGQVIPLGEQVLDLVLSDIQRHPALQQLQVAVNISAQQLQRYNFAKYLKGRLAHFKVAPANLALELTEGIFVGEGKTTIASLQALSDLGCTVAIDDFGTGFSSLSYLNRLPADVIKIDRAFTAGLTEDLELQAVVRGIVELCDYLGKKVVVEGIESEAQCEIFQQLGVQRLQGFYFARPMPLDKLLTNLNN
ncbi:Cyclic di-GMP phosphodiesterase Gmr [Pseudidiomarina piscicola]|uniref:Cyclic di-GMP phosphodiesterase Gmr n=1 Tax=Pseudidiomarina piscicola TaxID=2614830 RepID=A0A6S6WMV2_9GAMM|nr:bifunctional diguanylate cyclase/phosphodiesterase [Pseudidiomarina piscicola]CAB0151408.1 Cyclic di-GMP phosphodiesterase Gmr [Pseudidiomarina piscicola]VZT40888.1 Cyclic di-GMP phosphodiesterase Gmr [Pseudomonas aeruginosa]